MLENISCPSNLEEAVNTIISFMTKEKLFELMEDGYFNDGCLLYKVYDREPLPVYFTGFLMRVWDLNWKQNSGKPKPLIVQYFNELKIYHILHMVDIIVTTLYRTLKNVDIKLDEQIENKLASL